MPGVGGCSAGSHNFTKASAPRQLPADVSPGRKLEQAGKRKDTQAGWSREEPLRGSADLTHMPESAHLWSYSHLLAACLLTILFSVLPGTSSLVPVQEQL